MAQEFTVSLARIIKEHNLEGENMDLGPEDFLIYETYFENDDSNTLIPNLHFFVKFLTDNSHFLRSREQMLILL